MMGKNHAKHGIMACAIVGASGVVSFMTATLLVPPAIFVVAAELIIAGSVSPDIDGPSNATNSFGLITKTLSKIVRLISKGVYALTRGSRDAKGKGAHRYLTHTAIGNVTAGLILMAVCSINTQHGPLPAAVALGMLAGIGTYALKKRWKWQVTLATAVVVYVTPGVTNTWLWIWGLAFALGCAVHCIGDGCTETGIPYWWHPFRRSSRRWDRAHVLPERLRFTTGEFGENITLFFSFVFTACVCALFIWAV